MIAFFYCLQVQWVLEESMKIAVIPEWLMLHFDQISYKAQSLDFDTLTLTHECETLTSFNVFGCVHRTNSKILLLLFMDPIITTIHVVIYFSSEYLISNKPVFFFISIFLFLNSQVFHRPKSIAMQFLSFWFKDVEFKVQEFPLGLDEFEISLDIY